MSNKLLLSGKTVIVLGAAGKLGHAITNSVIAAGARVLALDTNADKLAQLQTFFGDSLHYTVVDMSDRTSLEAVMRDADRNFGGVDGAVNAAYPRNPNYGRNFLDVQYEDFCENLSLHLGGYFLFMQSCVRYALTSKRDFSLVNLSSIYGSMSPRFSLYEETKMTMPIEYAGIKAGLEHMTRYVNSYMKGRCVSFRANCVSPGGILSGQDKSFLDRYGKHCLGKGMLDGQDITGSIIFLLSDASRYVVGQNLIVDDGFSI
jgi:NAD(P)-dependent dehydrogenase (short-subunit alcohol dehydrogenase family)